MSLITLKNSFLSLFKMSKTYSSYRTLQNSQEIKASLELRHSVEQINELSTPLAWWCRLAELPEWLIIQLLVCSTGGWPDDYSVCVWKRFFWPRRPASTSAATSYSPGMFTLSTCSCCLRWRGKEGTAQKIEEKWHTSRKACWRMYGWLNLASRQAFPSLSICCFSWNNLLDWKCSECPWTLVRARLISSHAGGVCYSKVHF